MSTRFFIVATTIFLLLGYTGVHAGDFSMHTVEFGSPAAGHDAGMDTDRAESDFSIGHELSSRNLRNESNSARIITPSGRSYGAGASALNTPSSSDEDSQPSTQLGDSAGSARATLPGAATPTQKARAGNRWQSLVPGAIK